MPDIGALAKGLQEQLVQWRREFHQCPELKMDTPLTSSKIERILREIGITDIRTDVGGKGVCCTIHGAEEGKCLGIRADCDGLPVREETGLSFASVNGNMHACGHDAHTAMALGAAKIIFEHRDELRGRVKMIFQPYEEGAGGADAMIADGVLENPHVDGMIALHTGNIMGKEFCSGDVCCHPEVSSFASCSFDITFQGKSTHVCSPQLGADPVLAACTAAVQLQMLMNKEREPSQPAVIAVSMVHGGERYNIIPDSCRIGGSIRAVSKEALDRYVRRVVEICESAAASMGCSIGTVEYPVKVYPVMNDSGMVKKFYAAAEKIVSPEHIRTIRQIPPMGEDFSWYSLVCPSVYFYHCTAFGDERDYPHHNSKFNIDESNLWSGTGILAQFAFDWQKT